MSEATPEPVSVADKSRDEVFDTQPEADGAGEVWALATGADLSTSNGPSGPTAEQFPTWSQTETLLVEAAAVAVPGVTLVETVVDAWAGTARPDWVSETAQVTETSVLVQAAGADGQETAGPLPSTLTVIEAVDETLPARSVAVKTKVVVPAAVRLRVVDSDSGLVAPAVKTVPLPAWAPVAE